MSIGVMIESREGSSRFPRVDKRHGEMLEVGEIEQSESVDFQVAEMARALIYGSSRLKTPFLISQGLSPKPAHGTFCI